MIDLTPAPCPMHPNLHANPSDSSSLRSNYFCLHEEKKKENKKETYHFPSLSFIFAYLT